MTGQSTNRVSSRRPPPSSGSRWRISPWPGRCTESWCLFSVSFLGLISYSSVPPACLPRPLTVGVPSLGLNLLLWDLQVARFDMLHYKVGILYFLFKSKSLLSLCIKTSHLLDHSRWVFWKTTSSKLSTSCSTVFILSVLLYSCSITDTSGNSTWDLERRRGILLNIDFGINVSWHSGNFF